MQIYNLLGAAMIAGAILAAQFISPYRYVGGIDAAQNPILWRANSITGAIELCSASQSYKPRGSNPFEQFEDGALKQVCK